MTMSGTPGSMCSQSLRSCSVDSESMVMCTARTSSDSARPNCTERTTEREMLGMGTMTRVRFSDLPKTRVGSM